ncbi:MAG: DUF885 domain-containing protein, partial [Polyangiales bacterium]
TPKGAATDPAGFVAVRDRLVARLLREDPAWARNLGMHEYDGKVADYSQKALVERRAFLEESLSALDAIDASKLSEDDALDRAILKNQLSLQLFVLAESDEPHKEPQFYEDMFGVNVYVDRAYAPLEVRGKQLLAHEEAALTQAPHIKANLLLPLSRTVAKVAAKNYAGYAEYLRGDVMKVFGAVGDAAFKKKLSDTNEQLAQAADAVAAWLEKDVVPTGNDAHVLGAERFRKLVAAQEGLTTSIDDLSTMAEADLAKNKAAYDELSKSTSPTRPKATELMTVATGLVTESRQFLVDHHIVTIPSDDTATVKESPPFMRWNSAFLESSGPFDPYRIAFFYITLPDPTWPQKEQEDYVSPYGVMLATTVHEVYPGHFLQGRFMERAPTQVQKMSWSYSFGEGWAHYGEQMMIEEGFHASDPQAKLGQLADALLRNCRFVVSIGLHTRGMTLEQATRRFVDDCHQDEATARSQAERGTFDPGYFAYTLGKLQILALRDEAKKKLGASFSLQKFHDALLSHGAPPVALIHDRVLKAIGAGS